MASANRQFLIDHLPKGKLGPEVFKLGEGPIPSPKDGEVLLRTRYISLDAANRAWMWGATYRAALSAGQVMAGGSLAEVVESRAPGFAAGDFVFADTGWQDYAALPAKRASISAVNWLAASCLSVVEATRAVRSAILASKT